MVFVTGLAAIVRVEKQRVGVPVYQRIVLVKPGLTKDYWILKVGEVETAVLTMAIAESEGGFDELRYNCGDLTVESSKFTWLWQGLWDEFVEVRVTSVHERRSGAAIIKHCLGLDC